MSSKNYSKYLKLHKDKYLTIILIFSEQTDLTGQKMSISIHSHCRVNSYH